MFSVVVVVVFLSIGRGKRAKSPKSCGYTHTQDSVNVCVSVFLEAVEGKCVFVLSIA